MLKRQSGKRLTWGLIALILWSIGGIPTAYSLATAYSSGSKADLRLRTSAADHLILELTVPDLQLEEIEAGGQQVTRLSAPGLDLPEGDPCSLAAPEQPALPYLGVLIGLPPMGLGGLPPTGEMSVEVTAVDREVVPLAHPVATVPMLEAVSPAFETLTPLPDAFAADCPNASGQAIGADAFYPASAVEVGDVAWLRDLRVARLRLYPLRYNAARGELEVARRLLVTVRFSPVTPVDGLALSRAADAWDPILKQAVINYDVARAWRSAARSAAPSAPALASGRFKVEVDADGLYQLTYTDLQAASFPVTQVDPRHLHLTLAGQEVAIQVEGETDGTLDPGDRILFYGQAAHSRYTGANIYWLFGDEVPGLRMAQIGVTPTGAYPAPSTHTATIHLEEDHTYHSYYAEASGDHWYWTDLAFLQTGCPTAVQSYTFSLPHLWPTGHTAKLRTSVQGYSSGTHDLDLRLKNQLVGNLLWTGATRLESERSVNSTLLSAGQNTLKLENGSCPPPPPPSPPANGMLFNYFELDYQATFVADGNRLEFLGQAGGAQYLLTGFAVSNLILFDVTSPASPARLTGARIEPGYRLTFEHNPSQAHRYLALAESAIRTPRAFYQDSPSGLASPANGADYVLIGYGQFLPAAQPLLALRTAQGLQAISVDVQDIFDEFSYGLSDPQAIHDFLAYALANWQLPPTYIVLLGDGTTDPLDHLGNGWHNYLPAYLLKVDPYLGETASENRLVTVSGADILPDLYIGRLPVTSVEQAEAVVAKIVDYETTPVPGSWHQRVLLVADNADGAGDFVGMSDDLYDQHLPAPFVGGRIYLVATPDEPYEYDPFSAVGVQSARSALRGSFAAGNVLVNYMGHSSHSQWAQEILLHRDDVPNLQNGDRLPVVLSMTCYTGAFQHPPYAPLDERLMVEPNGGAVATWGPTGAGVAAGHYYLSQGYFDTVFADGPTTLGAATLAGKLEVYTHSTISRYLVDTYALLGDPATRMDFEAGIFYGTYLPIVMRSYP